MPRRIAQARRAYDFDMTSRILRLLLAVGLGLVVTLPQPAVSAQEPVKATPTAQAVLDNALKAAVAADKGVFIHFGASWCGWCHKLEAFLETPDGKLLEDYVIVTAMTVMESKGKEALENAGGAALMKQWGGTGGLPYYVFLDKTGAKLSDANGMPDGGNIGYPANPVERAAFDQVLLKGVPKLLPAARAKMIEYLEKHPG
jgi:thiol:disulfide interchange protein